MDAKDRIRVDRDFLHKTLKILVKNGSKALIDPDETCAFAILWHKKTNCIYQLRAQNKTIDLFLAAKRCRIDPKSYCFTIRSKQDLAGLDDALKSLVSDFHKAIALSPKYPGDPDLHLYHNIEDYTATYPYHKDDNPVFA